MNDIVYAAVLDIYRITLLSNKGLTKETNGTVLDIYRITLLSNPIKEITYAHCVLDIYRITLLSNTRTGNRAFARF